MSATTAKKTPQRDRHSTPVIVTATGQLLAGKRRIAHFIEQNGARAVLLSEWHHYAMLPYLRVARDDEGQMHLCTTTTADEQGWDLVEA